MRSTSDLDAYLRLLNLSKDLDAEAEACWSPMTAAAYRAGASFMRRLASAVYAKGLKD